MKVSIPKVGEALGPALGDALGSILGDVLALVSLSSSPIHWPLPRASIGKLVGLDDGTPTLDALVV